MGREVSRRRGELTKEGFRSGGGEANHGDINWDMEAIEHRFSMTCAPFPTSPHEPSALFAYIKCANRIIEYHCM